MASKVLNRIPFTLPVFRSDKLVIEIPTRFDNSVKDIFLFAIITSMLITIAIREGYYQSFRLSTIIL